MRFFLKWGLAVAVCLLLVGTASVSAAGILPIAEDGSETVSETASEHGVPWSSGPSGTVGTEAVSSLVSPGLRNLAAATDLAVSVKVGESYSFDESDFLRGMNLSGFSYVTVTAAPKATEGTLFLGASAVQSGQVISVGNLPLLSYTPAGTAPSVGTFDFSIDGAGYSVTCRVYSLSELGAAPTTAYAPEAMLSASTHRDLSFGGTLSGYDPDGDALVYEIVSAPEHGSVRILDRAAGTYRYTPYAGYTGEDSFRYVVRDARGNYSKGREVTLSVSEPTVSVSFSDLGSDSAVNAALTMEERGIMSGTAIGGEVFFYPEKTVSRVDFLVMAMRTLGFSAKTGNVGTVFLDEAAIPEALRGYVAAAYEKGVVSGVFGANGLYFLPDRAVTRAEAAKILSSLVGISESVSAEVRVPDGAVIATIAFDDGKSIPAWAKEAVYHLSALGVFTAEGGNAAVNTALTRGEAAEMLSALLRIAE